MAGPRFFVMVDEQPLPALVLGLLTRLELRESEAEPGVAILRFNLSQKEDGCFIPLDDDIFTPAARLGLQLEVAGGTKAHLFSGFVTHVRPHFETIESNCYMEIMAMDAAVLLQAEERVEAYPDQTDKDAAEHVFQRYSISFSGENTQAIYEEKKQLLVQRSTDWEFVQQLARRNGFVCYLEPDPLTGEVTAHFCRRDLRGTAQADLTLLRDDTNLRWLDLQLVTTGPTRVGGTAFDPLAKHILQSAGEPASETLGDTLPDHALLQALNHAGSTGATALLRDPPTLDAALSAAASAATDRALFVIEARGEIDTALYRGLLRARRPVLIKGVGRAFAGAYYVRTVRTVLAEGTISQTFVAERNALGLSGKEVFGQRAEEVPAR